MSIIRHGGRVIQFHELMICELGRLNPLPMHWSVMSMAEMVSDVERMTS